MNGRHSAGSEATGARGIVGHGAERVGQGLA
jgi:hypothetical protein